MNNSIRVPEDKNFVCAFVASPESIIDAMECYRSYLDSVEEKEFEHALLYLLCSILDTGGTDVTINDEVRICIEHLINEKNIIRKNNTDQKA